MARKGSSGIRVAVRTKAMDAVSVLSIYMLLLYAIPSDRRIGALGSAGSLATLFALGLALWWCWFHIQRNHPAQSKSVQPVRIAKLIFLGSATASYVAASLRPLPPLEASTVDTSLLRLVAWAGVLFVANDGIADMERLVALLRRLALAGALLAVLGILQFITKLSLVDYIQIPGLISTQSFSAIGDRGGFTRSAATAQSPLEYAAVLAMIFPISLALALTDKGRSALLRWAPVAIMAPAIMLSISRSAFLAVAIGMLALFPSLPRKVKIRSCAAAVALVGVMYLAVPGMLGTILNLFQGISEDSSTTSRTDSYGLVGEFVARSPWFGRGFGTFLPQYRILDNQYLGILIELGFVGLAAFGAVLVTSIVVCIRGRRTVTAPQSRLVGSALAASLLSGTVTAGFFDVFSFPMSAGTLFLVMGIAGAYWRISIEAPIQIQSSTTEAARLPLYIRNRRRTGLRWRRKVHRLKE
ncbi:O-antigen ligase family protein [Specibacter sp. NPDC078692]|uniref:O-antigen ligase family protein n=1 Tax=Specibacter sp. NPDC078692 TaxID=3155818 RepID=UPI00341B0D8E